MLIDSLWERLVRKISRGYIALIWKGILGRCQGERKSDQFFFDALGVSSKNEAIERLNAQFTIDIFGITGRGDIPTIIEPSDVETIEILGSRLPVDEISKNWHTDWISGKSWPIDWHWKIRKVRWDGSDVKVPWELSRCHFLVHWGQCYVVSGERKYIDRFVGVVESWISSNPVGRGVNWTCAMDVAIRASNWLLAWNMFRGADSINDEFVWAFYKSIYFHGLFVEHNLEGPGAFAANHYVADLAGLFYIGVLCPAFGEKSEKWENFARGQLKSEIDRQVLPDGVVFEQSTMYHRLSFELFFYPYWLSSVCGRSFSNEYVSQLTNMVDVVSKIIKPGGLVPQIGDNDGGQFFKLSEASAFDLRYLLDIGVTVLRKNNLKIENRPLTSPVLWLAGHKAENVWRETTVTEQESPRLEVMPIAGWNVIDFQPWWVFINTGSDREKSIAAHAHVDRLSFELCFRGNDLFVDPGTYVYTRDANARRIFRSANYHNGLIFGEGEIASYVPGEDGPSVFYKTAPPAAKLLMHERNHSKAYWVGLLDLKGGYWKRSFEINSEKVVVTDHVSEVSTVTGCLNLHPSVSVFSINQIEQTVALAQKNGALLDVRLSGVRDVKVTDSYYSRAYGIKEKAIQLQYSLLGDISEIEICPQL